MTDTPGAGPSRKVRPTAADFLDEEDEPMDVDQEPMNVDNNLHNPAVSSADGVKLQLEEAK